MGLLQSLKELIFGKEKFEVPVEPKPEKVYDNKCSTCGKELMGLDRFFCFECDKAFCSEHRLHASGHKSTEPEEESKLANYGRCSNCKKLIKHVYDKTVCPYCMRHLCMHCFPEQVHKCKHDFKSRPRVTSPKIIDKVLTIRDITAIRKAKKELIGYASLEREISGLIGYDGKISRTTVGTPESVEPDSYSIIRGKGIHFHTHPNENTLPSRKDYEYAALIQGEGSKVKSIVVTQLGFASYSQGYTSTVYWWYEI
jgi:hypothetical protein